MNKYLINETETSDGRAQVKILDFGDRATFIVDYLPSHYHPSTPFAKGEQLYYGESITEAIRIVKLVFGPRVKLPTALTRKIEQWG